MDDLRLSNQQPEVDPEETTTHPIASKWQKNFIDKCRMKVQNEERTMKFDPHELILEVSNSVLPTPWPLYIATVYVYSPMEQFPTLSCNCSCSGSLTRYGWNGSRYVHDLIRGFYLVTARYKCTRCKKVMSALDANASSAVRNYLPVHCTGKSAVSTTLIELIVSDSTTGKSFEAMSQTIKELRATEYMRRLTLYLQIAKDALYKLNTEALSVVHNGPKECENFGCLDDKDR